MAWTAPRTWVGGEIFTATNANTHIRDNMKELWHEVAYTEFNADVTIGNPAETAPVDIVSAGAITFTALPILIEFWASGYTSGNGGLSLWDASTDLGRMTIPGAYTPEDVVYLARRLTPTAASHTYKIRGWATSGSPFVRAGAGGVATKVPGYIRITQKGG